MSAAVCLLVSLCLVLSSEMRVVFIIFLSKFYFTWTPFEASLFSLLSINGQQPPTFNIMAL